MNGDTLCTPEDSAEFGDNLFLALAKAQVSERETIMENAFRYTLYANEETMNQARILYSEAVKKLYESGDFKDSFQEFYQPYLVFRLIAILCVVTDTVNKDSLEQSIAYARLHPNKGAEQLARDIFTSAKDDPKVLIHAFQRFVRPLLDRLERKQNSQKTV